ncbi:MAG TPA: cupin domain-containing protein [Acidimicrobiales bacterium]|jgi:mannose-6-phosphate isomerase-like protein (cupin superfamily)|nr:cupin domain-containing protein [Acidimicrobiales bacterium]
MTSLVGDRVGVVRAADAETLIAGSSTLKLLLDSSQTGGALSAHHVHLGDGADGASPHRHTKSSEMFYVVDGSIQILAGRLTLTATKGDLVVVPPGTAHAFAATPGCDGELLVVITPGVERFEFFRELFRVMTGRADPTHLKTSQAQYDAYRAESPEWDSARAVVTEEKGAQ